MLSKEIILLLVVFGFTVSSCCLSAIVVSSLVLAHDLAQYGIESWRVPLSAVCITFLLLVLGTLAGALGLTWYR